jgi:hypothetical protein
MIAKATLCGNCDTSVTKFHCLDCKRSGDSYTFCLGCSIIHGKVKSSIHHSLEPVQDLDTVLKKTDRKKKAASAGRSVSFVDGGDLTIEDEEDDEEDVSFFSTILSQVLKLMSRLEKIVIGRSTGAILQDKQGTIILTLICLGGYLLIKRFLGRHVSMIVAVGGVVGLRWFQRRETDGERGANRFVEIKGNATLDEATAAVYRRYNSAPEATRPMRSIGAAAAALDEAESNGQFADEFWHVANASRKRPSRPMRVQVKDRKGNFNANSDT